MHEQIKYFLKLHNFRSSPNWNGYNESEVLKNALKRCGNDESKFLRDIDTYSFYAVNGKISFRFKERRTYLNLGKFSYNYYNNHFESIVFDKKGKPADVIILTDEDLDKHELHIFWDNSSAKGELFFYSDTPEYIKKRIMDSKESDILYECRKHFGKW